MDRRLAKNQIVVLDGIAMAKETTTNPEPQTQPSVSRPAIGQSPICHAPVTIFAIPKAFIGDSDRIQRNAIGSWKQLSPAVDVLLFGDEEGIGEFAHEIDAAHESHLERNSHGTPLVNSAFAVAHELSSSPVLVYCNSDIILGPDFVQAIERLSNGAQFKTWLAIAERVDVEIDREIDFQNQQQLDWLHQHCASNGKQTSRACKEFFAFSRNLYRDVPPFAIGRGNWDNWMVASVKADGIPVIDLSESVSVIHQAHDYSHMNASRMECYVNGTEARENQRLAGGRNLISGSTCTYRLRENGVEPIGTVEACIDLFRDVPKFANLSIQLLLGRS